MMFLISVTVIYMMIVEFCSIVRHSPSHGQWENARPLSGIRVDLVMNHVVLVRDQVNPSLLGKSRYDVVVLVYLGIKGNPQIRTRHDSAMVLSWGYRQLVRDQVGLVRDQVVLVRDKGNPSLLGKSRYDAVVLGHLGIKGSPQIRTRHDSAMVLSWGYGQTWLGTIAVDCH